MFHLGGKTDEACGCSTVYVSIPPCLCSTLSMFHLFVFLTVSMVHHACSAFSVFSRVYVPPCVPSCLYSTISGFHHVYVPPRLDMFHHVYVPRCLCFHYVFIPSCQYFALSDFHHVYQLPCLYSTMFMIHRFCIPPCTYSTLFTMISGNPVVMFHPTYVSLST